MIFVSFSMSTCWINNKNNQKSFVLKALTAPLLNENKVFNAKTFFKIGTGRSCLALNRIRPQILLSGKQVLRSFLALSKIWAQILLGTWKTCLNWKPYFRAVVVPPDPSKQSFLTWFSYRFRCRHVESTTKTVKKALFWMVWSHHYCTIIWVSMQTRFST